jgi:GT2 family glycosyltransferase
VARARIRARRRETSYNSCRAFDQSGMIRFSFLIPTRARVDSLARLLESVADTTARPDELEIVLGIDEDDTASQGVTRAGLRLAKTIVPPGSSMGALNTACFTASSGRFVMLLNDDVILRTRGWDLEVASVLAQFDDDIALVHVNDRLFGDRLCTFPLVSRRACLEIGVCPTDYRRYRIDDHIHDTYYLLAHLGYRRMTYLEGVVFEHQNWMKDEGQTADQLFKTGDGRLYVPDQAAIDRDAALFGLKLPQRKADAGALAHLIETSRVARLDRRHALTLAPMRDAATIRRTELVARRPPAAWADRPTVTVAVVTADVAGRHAQDCLARLKRHTGQYDLLLLDNNRSPDFCHPREMNRAMRAAAGDFLVVMDDDVLVDEGWLDRLIASLDSRTGIVAPLHRDAGGQVSFSGVYFLEEGGGTHGHLLDIPDAPRACQAVCSALMLIDLRKCGAITFAEQFTKYFFDLDYSLRVWEAGYRVVCTPYTIVTHLAGATQPAGAVGSSRRWNSDLAAFMGEWIDSGRLAGIQNGVWQDDPVTASLVAVPRRIRELVENAGRADASRFEVELQQLLYGTQRFPLFRTLLARALRGCLEERQTQGDQPKVDLCVRALGTLKDAPLIQFGRFPIQVDAHLGYNVFECEDEWIAVPPSLGAVDFRRREDLSLPGLLRAPTFEAITALLDTIGPDPASPVLLGTIGAHNLVAFGRRTYAVPQRLGPVDLATPEGRSRRGIIVADSREAVEAALRR